MLERVVALANSLHRLRFALVGAGCIGLVLFAAGIGGGNSSGVGLAGLVLLIWASFFAALGHFFAGREWRAPTRADPWAIRVRWRVLRAGAWLAVLAMATLAGLLILFTLRALSAF